MHPPLHKEQQKRGGAHLGAALRGGGEDTKRPASTSSKVMYTFTARAFNKVKGEGQPFCTYHRPNSIRRDVPDVGTFLGRKPHSRGRAFRRRTLKSLQ